MTSDTAKYDALHRWRRWHHLKGVPANRLPSDEELRRLANSRPRTPADVQRLRLSGDAKKFVAAHADEILMALDVIPLAPPTRSTAPATDPSKPRPSGPTTTASSAGRRSFTPTDAPPVQPGPSDSQVARVTGDPDLWVAQASHTADAAVDPAAAGGDVAELAFAPYQWEEPPLAPQELTPVVSADGTTVRLTWTPPQDAAAVVYRVYASDNGQPYDPDDPLGPVLTTTETTFTDSSDSHSAVRYYAVWANAGPDLAAAAGLQPYPHATATAVRPVRDALIRNDGAVVLGTWRAGPGATRVEVLRIPAALAAAASYDPGRFGVSTDSSNLNGFRDATVVPGEKYVYRAFVVAEIAGTMHRSRPFNQVVDVHAPLRAVQDLRGEHRDDERGNALVSLTWTHPHVGDLRVYRTRNGPAPGATEAGEIPVDALPQAELQEADLIPYSVDDVSATERMMRDVTWPEGWPRVSFTPVVVHGNRAVVGKSVALIRPTPVREVRLQERVQWQHLTFDWPEQATLVKVYLTGEDEDPSELSGAPLAQITAREYEDLGGLRLSGKSAIRTTKPQNSVLHLVSVMFADGASYTGRPVTVPYRGVLSIEYRIVHPPVARFRAAAPPQLEVRYSLPLQRPLAMRLVHRADRLPLSIQEEVQQLAYIEPNSAATQQWTAIAELPPLPSGFVRLFVDEPARFPLRIAVLDPPLRQLRISP